MADTTLIGKQLRCKYATMQVGSSPSLPYINHKHNFIKWPGKESIIKYLLFNHSVQPWKLCVIELTINGEF